MSIRKIVIYDFNQFKLLYLKYCQKEEQYVSCEVQTLVSVSVKLWVNWLQQILSHYFLTVTTKWKTMSFSTLPSLEVLSLVQKKSCMGSSMKNWGKNHIYFIFNGSSGNSIFSEIKYAQISMSGFQATGLLIF